MRSTSVSGDDRLQFWQRVREFAVPVPMIKTATARRAVGDWAGACAAARFDVDLHLRVLARTHGRDLAAEIRADLRHLAPDLLRWHMPRIAPDGLLRPGLTVTLARYGRVHLVVRTPPGWADAGQRISLALFDGTPGHPHPDRRFRLDLHRHLWDARRAVELRERSGGPARWAAEAAILLQAEGACGGAVTVRLSTRRRVLLHVADGPGHFLLPDAATWEPPDLALLAAGLIHPGRLHPLVAPGHSPGVPDPVPRAHIVACGGARHRLSLVGGELVPVDHDADEIRREHLLMALGGTPLPCLRAIGQINRRPEDLPEIRDRLDHGDSGGALDAVERLLGPQALLAPGTLRDELENAAQRRVSHGLFRAGLANYGPMKPASRRSSMVMTHA